MQWRPFCIVLRLILVEQSEGTPFFHKVYLTFRISGCNKTVSEARANLEDKISRSTSSSKLSYKFFVCLHGDKIYNSFVCGNTT